MAESKLAEVRRRLWAAWQMREKTGADVVADLSNMDLRDCNLCNLWGDDDEETYKSVGVDVLNHGDAHSLFACLDYGLRGADLRNCDLRKNDLTGVDLTGVDLRGADLTGAKLPSSIMVAVIDDTTIFDAKQRKQMPKWSMDELARQMPMP